MHYCTLSLSDIWVTWQGTTPCEKRYKNYGIARKCGWVVVLVVVVGGMGECRKLWCSFETFQTKFSPKYGKKLKIFGKIVFFFFGKMTQHCMGKCSKLLGKWSNLLGKCSKLLGKCSIFLGKRSNFDGEMKLIVGKMKQNMLGKCPKGKLQHPRIFKDEFRGISSPVCFWTNVSFVVSHQFEIYGMNILGKLLQFSCLWRCNGATRDLHWNCANLTMESLCTSSN